VIVLPLLVLAVTNIINKKIAFEIIQVGISMMLTNNVLFDYKSLNIFINTLPAITYLALFYDMITNCNFAGNYSIILVNVPALLLSITATINFLILKHTSFLKKCNLKKLMLN
jgi:hypothetical protein